MGRVMPTVLCLDVEPDFRELGNDARGWGGFEQTFERLRIFREEWRQRTGSPPVYSWFLRMDPQIAEAYGSATWVADRYSDLLEEAEGAGDSVGLHVHAWRRDSSDERWIADHANVEWIESCVRQSLAAFERAFARPATIFRFGDRWMSSSIVTLLGESGVRFDLTLEPGFPAQPALRDQELSTGFLPDYTSVPRHPYWPEPADFRRERKGSCGGIMMIPLSTARDDDRVGKLLADPNPVPVWKPQYTWATVLSWETSGVEEVEIRVGSPDGPLVSRGGSSGSAKVGEWLRNGTRFFLQDVEDGKPSTPDHTLDEITMVIETSPSRGSDAIPGPPRTYSTLNLAFSDDVVKRILEKCLDDPRTQHMAAVFRAGDHMSHLDANLDLLQRFAGTLRFVGPGELGPSRPAT